VLAQVQRIMPEVCRQSGLRRENIVFVSGIGCASRFPYYMNTYGFHSIHGRAPTVATGLKMARPELQVWVVTGDGDGLSIGANHLIHALRRNVDIKILLFNNRIYGLTKGQYSPTSELGKRTRSSPQGVAARPLNPLSLAVAARASFIARAIDTETKHLQQVLLRAAAHRGSAFVEIYQNCNIFNDGTFAPLLEKAHKAERLLYLEHGQPLRFGADGARVIVAGGRGGSTAPVIADFATSDPDEVIVHDERAPGETYAYALSSLDYPDFPVPVGVLRAVTAPTFEELVEEQIASARAGRGLEDLETLMHAGETWTVE
jgi:2-oxoglutarate ferredoxin oxidoreductase subunit beta